MDPEEYTPRILVIEDDASILLGLRDNLEMEDWEVDTAEHGDEGLAMALEGDYDVHVIDIMLPGTSGLDICKKLHQERVRGGKILLTAKAEDEDKLAGFDHGADDYVTKPFAIPELLARVRALLRRTDPRTDQLARFEFDDVTIDFERLEARKGEEELDLSPREFKILRIFAGSRGRVISRNELLDEAWGYDHYPTTRTVDNHIVKLRKAFDDDPSDPRYIESVRGVGYKFIGEGETRTVGELLEEDDTAKES